MNFQYDKWDSISETERESKIGILNGNGYSLGMGIHWFGACARAGPCVQLIIFDARAD